MKSRKLSGSIELRVNCYGKVAIAPNPDFFVTDEERKARVNGKEVKL